MASGPLRAIGGLYESVIDYANRVNDLKTPSDVLNGLHDITKTVALYVLGVARFPPKEEGWDSVQLGRSIFLQTGIPKVWWEDYQTLSRGRCHPLLSAAQSGIAPSTWAEVKQMVAPIGSDRWADHLFAEYGMRDGLSCPVGGRWVVLLWSRNDLAKMEQQTRNMIFAAASFSALRMEQLTRSYFARTEPPVRLTPREIAVLRLISTGARHREAAKALGIGEETVRSHVKSAQLKLDARNRAHAVAEALRRNLIP